MDEVLRSLGGLLLKAIPTFLLIVVLHFYLKRIFFAPLAKVLEQRSLATEGTRRLAEESLAKATAKAAEYDAALRSARNEVYREQEAMRLQIRQEHAAAIEAARQRSGAAVKDAGQQLAVELETAKQDLAQHTDTLADQIVASILRGRTV